MAFVRMLGGRPFEKGVAQNTMAKTAASDPKNGSAYSQCRLYGRATLPTRIFQAASAMSHAAPTMSHAAHFANFSKPWRPKRLLPAPKRLVGAAGVALLKALCQTPAAPADKEVGHEAYQQSNFCAMLGNIWGPHSIQICHHFCGISILAVTVSNGPPKGNSIVA
jgi:hypothetical protein